MFMNVWVINVKGHQFNDAKEMHNLVLFLFFIVRRKIAGNFNCYLSSMQ